MPASFFNRVRQAVASAPGTGAITLGTAASGYRTFATAGATNGLLVSYVLEDGAAWEFGRATYSSTGPTLTRTTIRGSSNGGAAINASTAAIVSCDAFAEDVTNQFTQIATTGDLSAAPVAAITFTGLDAYTDLVFDFSAAGHDSGTAQSFSAAFSVDGTTFTGVTAITPSISSGSAIHGQSTIIGNGSNRPVMRSGFGTGIINPPAWVNATEAPRVAIASATIVAMRFTPTTSGNWNKGVVMALGR